MSLLRRSRPRVAPAAPAPATANADASLARPRAQQDPAGMAAALEDLRAQGAARATDEAAEESWMDQVDAAQSQWLGAADHHTGYDPFNPKAPSTGDGGGMVTAFPDVCKVPAPPAPFIPIPYPNTGASQSAGKSSSKVKVGGGEESATKKTSGKQGRTRGHNLFDGTGSSANQSTGHKVEPSQTKVKVT